MATTNNIIPQAPPQAEPTEAERIAKQLVSDSDLALNRLANSVQTGFELIWGTKENPRPKAEAQAAVTALGENLPAVFSRHAATIAYLTAEGMATFEPWETVPAYVVGNDLQLGAMSPEWAA